MKQRAEKAGSSERETEETKTDKKGCGRETWKHRKVRRERKQEREREGKETDER